MDELTLRLEGPPSIAPAEIVQVWEHQRDRCAKALGALSREHWSRRSRCQSWSVADVVAHLGDGARRMTLVLETTGADTTFRDIDPRTEPANWIAGTDRAHALLLDEYLQSTQRLFDLARDAASARPTFRVWAPYRRLIPWELFMVHGLFDHWLHERDILIPLGCTHEPTSIDTSITATYSVLVAAVVASMHQPLAPVHLHLTGLGGCCTKVDVGFGTATTAPICKCAGDADGAADAVHIADVLTGRTPTVAAHVVAAPELVQSLATLADWFRAGP